MKTSGSESEEEEENNQRKKRRMALVSISNVEILDNPAPFTNPFQFEITFECVAELKGGTCHHLSSFYFFSKKKKIATFMEILFLLSALLEKLQILNGRLCMLDQLRVRSMTRC